MEPPDVGFFNAGQKLQFWEIVGGCIAYVITGVIMWFPEIFGRVLVAISYVIHDISALIMLFGIFVHIYLSTFGEPRHHSGDDARHGKRSLGVDASSGVVQGSHRTRSPSGDGRGTAKVGRTEVSGYISCLVS